MKQFKSKLPDAKGFQWKSGVDLETKLVELLGHSDFEIRKEAEFINLVELDGNMFAIYSNDYVLLADGLELMVFDWEELDEYYSEVH